VPAGLTRLTYNSMWVATRAQPRTRRRTPLSLLSLQLPFLSSPLRPFPPEPRFHAPLSHQSPDMLVSAARSFCTTSTSGRLVVLRSMLGSEILRRRALRTRTYTNTTDSAPASSPPYEKQACARPRELTYLSISLRRYLISTADCSVILSVSHLSIVTAVLIHRTAVRPLSAPGWLPPPPR
jgi:hypothetical protein